MEPLVIDRLIIYPPDRQGDIQFEYDNDWSDCGDTYFYLNQDQAKELIKYLSDNLSRKDPILRRWELEWNPDTEYILEKVSQGFVRLVIRFTSGLKNSIIGIDENTLH